MKLAHRTDSSSPALWLACTPPIIGNRSLPELDFSDTRQSLPPRGPAALASLLRRLMAWAPGLDLLVSGVDRCGDSPFSSRSSGGGLDASPLPGFHRWCQARALLLSDEGPADLSLSDACCCPSASALHRWLGPPISRRATVHAWLRLHYSICQHRELFLFRRDAVVASSPELSGA